MSDLLIVKELEERSKFLRDVISKRKTRTQVSDPVLIECLFRSISIPLALDINRCYVGDSKIAGRGLFASRKILKSEIITLYPPHYIVYNITPRGQPGTKHILKSDIVNSKELNWDDKLWNYQFNFNNEYSIIGDPQLTDDPSFLGHMINDGAKGHSSKTKFIAKDKEIYNNIFLRVNNCIPECIDNLWVIIVAIKDINPDEEILMGYGYDYWITQGSQ